MFIAMASSAALESTLIALEEVFFRWRLIQSTA